MGLLGRKQVTNRKLRQRRPWRARLPAPHVVLQAAGRGARRAAPTLVTAAVIAVVIAGGWLAYQWVRSSPRFAVADITVTGNARVTGAEVARLSGIRVGANVFSFSAAAVERRLEASPWIARAEVERRLPRGVRIHVVERAPAAVVNGGGLYLAARDGRVFKRARIDAGEAEGLPVVSGIDRALWKKDPAAAAALVRHALDVVERWRAVPGRPEPGEVLLSRDAVTVFTRDDAIAVRLGRATLDELGDRLRHFDAAWAALAPEERAVARAIHLDSATRAGRVTVRLEGERWPRGSETN